MEPCSSSSGGELSGRSGASRTDQEPDSSHELTGPRSSQARVAVGQPDLPDHPTLPDRTNANETAFLGGRSFAGHSGAIVRSLECSTGGPFNTPPVVCLSVGEVVRSRVLRFGRNDRRTLRKEMLASSVRLGGRDNPNAPVRFDRARERFAKVRANELARDAQFGGERLRANRCLVRVHVDSIANVRTHRTNERTNLQTPYNSIVRYRTFDRVLFEVELFDIEINPELPPPLHPPPRGIFHFSCGGTERSGLAVQFLLTSRPRKEKGGLCLTPGC
jgi:hypothetical protein